MGNPKRTLSEKYFAGAPLYSDCVRVEQCEAMHIHWRDMRILLTLSQFKAISELMETVSEKWNGQLSPNTDIPLCQKTLPDATLFENRGLIEEQHGELIHVHYGDLRLELQPQAFLMMARLFEQAKREYNKTRVTMIPLDSIDAYDSGHFESEEAWREYDRQHPGRVDTYDYHQNGVALIMHGLKHGRKLRPISVVENGGRYTRLDGFKRYMAWKRLIQGDIPCYIERLESGHVAPGVQDGQPWFLEG